MAYLFSGANAKEKERERERYYYNRVIFASEDAQAEAEEAVEEEEEQEEQEEQQKKDTVPLFAIILTIHFPSACLFFSSRLSVFSSHALSLSRSLYAVE